MDGRPQMNIALVHGNPVLLQRTVFTRVISFIRFILQVAVQIL